MSQRQHSKAATLWKRLWWERRGDGGSRGAPAWPEAVKQAWWQSAERLKWPLREKDLQEEELWRGPLEARLPERLEQEQLKRRNLALVSKWSLRQQRLWASAVEADWSNKAKMEAAWVLMEWRAQLGIDGHLESVLERQVLELAEKELDAEVEVQQWSACELTEVMLGAVLKVEEAEDVADAVGGIDAVQVYQSLLEGNVAAMEAVELRKLWRAARKSKDERALRLWEQWKLLQKPVEQTELDCGKLVEFKTELDQWIGSVVEGGGEDEVSASWLKAVGLKGCLAAEVGDVVELVLRSGGVEQCRHCRVVDRADEMGAGSVWLKGWRKREKERPAWKQPMVHEDELTWGSEDVDPLGLRMQQLVIFGGISRRRVLWWSVWRVMQTIWEVCSRPQRLLQTSVYWYHGALVECVRLLGR
jgi:hypothetical protein